MIVIDIDGVQGRLEALLHGYPFSEELRAAYDAAGQLYPQREDADGHFVGCYIWPCDDDSECRLGQIEEIILRRPDASDGA